MKRFLFLAVAAACCFGCKSEEAAPPAPAQIEQSKASENSPADSKGPPPPGGWDADKK